MFFVTVFLVILAAVFTIVGLRSSNKDMRNMGFIFFIAAFGSGLITFFAWSTFG